MPEGWPITTAQVDAVAGDADDAERGVMVKEQSWPSVGELVGLGVTCKSRCAVVRPLGL